MKNRTLDICGYTYKVQFTPDYPIVDESQTWGACDNQSQEILCYGKLPAERKRTIICHEISHAIFACLPGDKKTEEQIVDAMGHGWAQVLTRNRDFVTWLWK